MIVAIAATFPALGQQTGKGWQNLFNGKDLSGWKRLGGKAEYSVEDGVIVGRTVPNSRNTFLCTEKEYGDFILELDAWVEDEQGNAGIQTRSHFDPTAFNGEGRVYGRQCEIDPTARAWTGGIYDEGRREWLYPMQLNAPAQNAYKKGAYNHYRVECIGNEMRTWVNGIATAYVIDTIDNTGFIGLQVHAIQSPDHAGKKVCFRNIRIQTTGLKPTPFPPGVYVANFVPNNLSAYEKKDGWKLLFDGKTTNGWRSAKGNEFPSQGWVIGNGQISVVASDGKESRNGGDII
ncbi:MAG TPA: family 16 glycoside hydrolase, partial [Chitinophagaceae bacterium]|nr:family 16 glycoside hydrolase [Chitinophagaceae bacterium]